MMVNLNIVFIKSFLSPLKKLLENVLHQKFADNYGLIVIKCPRQQLFSHAGTFSTWVIVLINQSEEICLKQFSFCCFKGGQNSPVMHVALLLPSENTESLSRLFCFDNMGRS